MSDLVLSQEFVSKVVTGAAATLFTILLGALAFFLKRWISSGDRKAEKHDELLKLLGGEVHKVHLIVTEMNGALRGAIEKLSERLEASIREQNKAEGRMDQQLSIVTNFITSIGHLDKKLAKVFEYIDAPKRPTDQDHSKG